MARDLSENEQVFAREFLSQHKPFLRAVCNTENARQLPALLGIGTDSDLDALAYVIYLVCQKVIPIDERDLDEIERRKKYKRVREYLGKSNDFERFKELSRSSKIQELKSLGIAPKLFLYPLFYRDTAPPRPKDQSEAEASKIQDALSNAVPKVKRKK
jgi:hypothetical protein